VNVRIDTLRLEVSGMSPDAARQFGRLVAERLGAMLAGAPQESGPARVTTLRVSVPWQAGASPGGLAASAAAEVSRALRTEATR
jgi:hypothetical protein